MSLNKITSRYVYLVVIWHPNNTFYYVGKHSWHGVGIDPNYFGSSTYSQYKKWLSLYSHSLRVLQWCDRDTIDKAEQYWIRKCLDKHGSFLRDLKMSDGTSRYWLQSYKSGTCLNGHWAGESSLTKALKNCNSPEARAKSNATKLSKYGCCITPEAIAKGLQTRILNGSQEKFRSAGTEAARAPEVVARSHATKSKNAIANRVKYILSDGFVGDFEQVANHIGWTSDHCRTCAKWLHGKRALPKRFSNITFELYKDVVK